MMSVGAVFKISIKVKCGGIDTLTAVVMNSSVFRNAVLANCFTLVDPECGGICSSERSVEFQRTTRRYSPENRTILKKEFLLIRKGYSYLSKGSVQFNT
jgi:hypothetical protein